MTNALVLVAAGLFFVGGAILFTARRRRDEANRGRPPDSSRADDDDFVDLSRRHKTHEAPQPPPGAPEWMPPGRDPEARA